MKVNRWIALPLAGIAAVAIGVGVTAASPSPSPSGATDFAQVFVDKLAGILHLSSSETRNDLKQAELQTIDQMVKDGKITQAQADALKNHINSSSGLGFPLGHFRAPVDHGILSDVRTAELDAAAAALKMTRADLEAQLRAGTRLSTLEQQKGVSADTVRNAERDAAKSVLDKAVKEGKITQGQEDEVLSKVGNRPPFGGHVRPAF